MRHWILVATILIGLGIMPAPTNAASKPSNECPHSGGQYYRPILPFFDSRNHQITLVERYTYRVVQVLADHIQEMYFLGYDAWSPSCRYFAFAMGPWAGNQTFIWDTVEQKLIGIFQRKTYRGLHLLFWGDSDDYVIVGTIAGQFLWKIPSNEQIQMNYHDGSALYKWDTPHNQVLTFDGRQVVAYDLNTGKILKTFFSPFIAYFTQYDFTSDGKTLTVYDTAYDKWAVTWDRATGQIIDAHAEPGRRPEEVQFSPDRRFLVIGGYGITIYDVTQISQPDSNLWLPYDFIRADNYSWRFADASTLELTYRKGGKQRLYDLNSKQFR